MIAEIYGVVVQSHLKLQRARNNYLTDSLYTNSTAKLHCIEYKSTFLSVHQEVSSAPKNFTNSVHA